MSQASIWIKICANTSLEDARLAFEAGADAVGFVFAPSPRRVTAAEVAAIVPQLPETVEKIGVFVDAGFDEIASTVEACGLTGAQLHFNAPGELTARLRDHFGAKLRILRVVHFGAANREESAAGVWRWIEDPHVDAMLVDSRTTAAVGGTGVAFDWSAASKALFQNPAVRQRLIAAGGLTPENVAQAIAVLCPWGVDVVSGVEDAPGKKNPAKVREFIACARGWQRR